MGAEYGFSIEKINGIDYPKCLQKMLEFDPYLEVDTFTPLYWCGDSELHYDILWCIDRPFKEEDGYVLVDLDDVERIIDLFKSECDKFCKMKHLLYDWSDAEYFAERWQAYEHNIKILSSLRWLMKTKGFKQNNCKVIYYASY